MQFRGSRLQRFLAQLSQLLLLRSHVRSAPMNFYSTRRDLLLGYDLNANFDPINSMQWDIHIERIWTQLAGAHSNLIPSAVKCFSSMHLTSIGSSIDVQTVAGICHTWPNSISLVGNCWIFLSDIIFHNVLFIMNIGYQIEIGMRFRHIDRRLRLRCLNTASNTQTCSTITAYFAEICSKHKAVQICLKRFICHISQNKAATLVRAENTWSLEGRILKIECDLSIDRNETAIA